MKRIFSLLCCLLITTPALAESPIAIGSEIPAADTTMAGFQGEQEKSWTIAQSQGKAGTLVIFTCNHCPYVVAWQERVVAHANAYVEKGFGVIAINSNDPIAFPEDSLAGMKARAESLGGMAYPYVIDGTSDVARAFGARKTPEFFLFDAQGKLVYHGAFDNNAQSAEKADKTYLKDAMDAILEGREVSVATSKAMGCSIKFRD